MGEQEGVKLVLDREAEKFQKQLEQIDAEILSNEQQIEQCRAKISELQASRPEVSILADYTATLKRTFAMQIAKAMKRTNPTVVQAT